MPGPLPPVPKSLLGRHRLLAPSASIRVSPLSLGGMSLGDRWSAMMGECTKEMADELLDTYYELGGNFIDTANVYQGGQSEEWIGEWLARTGRRSEMVISTKYSLNSAGGQPVQQSNFGGTGTKTMHMAIEQSLKRLQTDYIDLYYVHAWDGGATQIPELMQSLNTLVQQGKILYLGISDTPAWVVAKANAYAREHGLRPFSVYQGRYSAQTRDLEREIMPMCRDEGMAIHAWGLLGNGGLKSLDSTEKGSRNTPHTKTGREESVSRVLDNVAKRRNVPFASVCIAYAMQTSPYFFPVLGGRKASHLKANVEALSLQLTPEDIAEIETGYDFDIGFPHNFIGLPGHAPVGPQDISILQGMGYFDYVAAPTAIKPHQGELNAQWRP